MYHLVCPKVVNRITRWVYDRNGVIGRLGRSMIDRLSRRLDRLGDLPPSPRAVSSAPNLTPLPRRQHLGLFRARGASPCLRGGTRRPYPSNSYTRSSPGTPAICSTTLPGPGS